MKEKRCYGAVDLFKLMWPEAEEIDVRYFYQTSWKDLFESAWAELVRENDKLFRRYGYLDIVDNGKALTVKKIGPGRPTTLGSPWIKD